jgi:flagellar biosynthesis GTPase FlhF
MSEEEREWEVQQILQRGRFNNITHYLVHWRGYEESEATWEPITNLENCEDAIMQFENTILNKTKNVTVGKRKRAKKSNKELAEEREKTDEQMSEDGKSGRNREEVSTNESQSRKNSERWVVDEGEVISQEILKRHMQIEVKADGKIV